MHGTTALALLALLLTPPAAALAPPAAPALPALPALPDVLPLRLEDGGGRPELVIGVPGTVAVTVISEGVAGLGHQPYLERKVWLNATLDSGEAVAIAPNPVVLAPGAARGYADVAFTPLRLGPLGLTIAARWDVLPGNATLEVVRSVVKDTLAAEGLAAGAPDADLDLALNATFRSGHLPGEPLGWRIEGVHTPVNGTEPLVWTAAEGTAAASPAGLPWSTEVRARYGPGQYTFRLLAGGARLDDAAAEVAVAVPEVRLDRGTINFTLEVPEHPTTLQLASDSVNADGKPKAPGSALITRVVVGDLNGLGDVRRVTFGYARNVSGTLVPVSARSLEALPTGLKATLEDRFEMSPMAAGDYVCTITADGTGAPQAQRTFVITDTKPEATLTLEAAAVQPAQATALRGALVVRDANYGTGPLDGSDILGLGTLHLKVLKGSTAVTEPGWALAAGGTEGASPLVLDLAAEGTRSSRFAYRILDGKGTLELPVEVRVPEGGAAGAYRLSASADNATLASVPFNVTSLPRVTKFTVGPALPGGEAPVLVEVSPADHATIALRTPWGAELRPEPGAVEVASGLVRWNTTLPVPRPFDDEAAPELTALADLGDGRVIVNPLGQPVNARSAALPVLNAPPTLEAGLRLGGVAVGDEAWVHPHAALELQLTARAADDNAVAADLREEVAPLAAEVRDWRGQWARFEVDGDFAPAGTVLRVQPLGVEPGRYALRVRAQDDDGAVAEQELAINIGTHFRLGLPADAVTFAPDANGTLRAEVPLRNLGNAAASSLAVLAEGLPPGAATNATLQLANGTLLRLPLVGGFARFEAARLVEPSEWAVLHLEVDARSGVRAGVFQGRIVVAGEAA